MAKKNAEKTEKAERTFMQEILNQTERSLKGATAKLERVKADAANLQPALIQGLESVVDAASALKAVAESMPDYVPPVRTGVVVGFKEGDKVKVVEDMVEVYGVKAPVTIVEVLIRETSAGSGRNRTFLKCRTPQDKTVVAEARYFERIA